MKEMKEMKILGDSVPLTNDYRDIHDLKFLKDNPRVYACTHGEPNFSSLHEERQQEIIYKKLLDESSVKNLIPEIRRHGGLMEPILIRHDTKEVIEGNSRLAVYRKLHSDPKEKGEWELIPCEIVSSLTDQQQVAFLNQIHVKGKTQWSAYEKANFAYVRKEKGWNFQKIADLFGESLKTIRTRIRVIEMMKSNGDNERSHFSYYDVLVRDKDISQRIEKGGLKRCLADIKALGSDEETNHFTAQELRKKLPVVMRKPKKLKKYEEGKDGLDDAYDDAEISHGQGRVKKATDLLKGISKAEIVDLEQNDFNAFEQSVRKLMREADRINGIAKERSQK